MRVSTSTFPRDLPHVQRTRAYLLDRTNLFNAQRVFLSYGPQFLVRVGEPATSPIVRIGLLPRDS